MSSCGTLPICIYYTPSKSLCQYPDLNLPLCNLTYPVKYAIMVMECRTLQAIGGSILSSGNGGDIHVTDGSVYFCHYAYRYCFVGFSIGYE